jgi:hypothetical protein
MFFGILADRQGGLRAETCELCRVFHRFRFGSVVVASWKLYAGQNVREVES